MSPERKCACSILVVATAGLAGVVFGQVDPTPRPRTEVMEELAREAEEVCRETEKSGTPRENQDAEQDALDRETEATEAEDEVPANP